MVGLTGFSKKEMSGLICSLGPKKVVMIMVWTYGRVTLYIFTKCSIYSIFFFKWLTLINLFIHYSDLIYPTLELNYLSLFGESIAYYCRQFFKNYPLFVPFSCGFLVISCIICPTVALKSLVAGVHYSV